jgi:hypothetical protein
MCRALISHTVLQPTRPNECTLLSAERLTQATLDSLKDPANGIDQGSEVVATGYHNLANVIAEQKGDCVKAEILVRESLRIRTNLYNDDHQRIGMSVGFLTNILSLQGKMGDETKELYERCLAIQTKQEGPDARNTAVVNIDMGEFYHDLAEIQQTTEMKVEYLRVSLSKHKESVRIYTEILGPDNPTTMAASSKASLISCKLSLSRHLP